jgi:hypothetical protein
MVNINCTMVVGSALTCNTYAIKHVYQKKINWKCEIIKNVNLI